MVFCVLCLGIVLLMLGWQFAHLYQTRKENYCFQSGEFSRISNLKKITLLRTIHLVQKSKRDENSYQLYLCDTNIFVIRTLVPVSLASVLKRFDCTKTDTGRGKSLYYGG